MSLEMRVVTDGGVSSPKERLNVNLGANKISAKGTSNVSAGPSMRNGPENLSRNPVCQRWRRRNMSGAPAKVNLLK